MINLKDDILTALKANTNLVSLLGGNKFYLHVAPQGTALPFVTYFEMTNFDSDYADDAPLASEIHFRVDVFSLGSTTAIAEQVDITMKSLGFGRTSATDLYDDESKYYQKSMRYSTKVKL